MSAAVPWWLTQPCLSFDLETTGVNAHEDRIVTASLVRIVPGKDPVTFDWLANPGDDIEIPEGAAAIHGITTEKAQADGQPIGEVLDDVTGHLAFALGKGVPVVAFNGAYDLTMLEAENQRHGVPTLADRLGGVDRIRPILDPLVMDKYASKFRKGGRKLTDLCKHHNVRLVDAHTSSADALAAGLLWVEVIRHTAAKFATYTNVEELHDAQVRWRAQQMDGLREYFDRKGTAHDGCDPGFPLYGQPAAAIGGAA